MNRDAGRGNSFDHLYEIVPEVTISEALEYNPLVNYSGHPLFYRPDGKSIIPQKLIPIEISKEISSLEWRPLEYLQKNYPGITLAEISSLTDHIINKNQNGQ